MTCMRGDRYRTRAREADAGVNLSRVAFVAAIASTVTCMVPDAATSASALCADPYQPGCVLPQDEPDRRTVRERLADPIPDLIERPDKQRATISTPSYSSPGPPIFLDIQGPRGMGR